ncbi:unnamed protein product, partial [Nesidiocoris tenuis]
GCSLSTIRIKIIARTDDRLQRLHTAQLIYIWRSLPIEFTQNCDTGMCVIENKIISARFTM